MFPVSCKCNSRVNEGTSGCRYNNLWRVLAAVDTYTGLAISHVQDLSAVADATLLPFLFASAIVALALSVAVIRHARAVFPTCRHAAVGSRLALALPRDALREVRVP